MAARQVLSDEDDVMSESSFQDCVGTLRKRKSSMGSGSIESEEDGGGKFMVPKKRLSGRISGEQSVKRLEEQTKMEIKENRETAQERSKLQKKKRSEPKLRRGDEKIQKILALLRKMGECMGRDVGGKVSITRADQIAGKDAMIMAQEELVGLLQIQLDMERKIWGLKEKLAKSESRMSMGKSEIGDLNNISRQREQQDTTDSGEWHRQKARKQRRTYAEVSGGMKGGAKVEGRIVKVGEEG